MFDVTPEFVNNYHLSVTGDEGVQVPYTVSIRFEGPGACENDTLEPDNTLFDANPLPADTTVAARICSGDGDWYNLGEIESGTEFRVIVRFSDDEGDLEARIAAGGFQLAVAESGTDDEIITFVAESTDVFYAEVYGFEVAQAPYTIMWEILE